MKRYFLMGMILFLSLIARMPAYASNSERYVYDAEDKAVVDTLDGTIRRFVIIKDRVHFVEANYLTGTLKVDGVLEATGFDYHAIDPALVLVKTEK